MKNDIQTVRRENLKRLLEREGGPTALGKRLGHSGPSYLSQMATGKRPISERTARTIESTVGLSEFELDQQIGESIPFNGTAARQLLSDVVRAVGEALDRAQVKPSSKKFAEIVALVYEHSASAGRVDQAYIQHLVSLLS